MSPRTLDEKLNGVPLPWHPLAYKALLVAMPLAAIVIPLVIAGIPFIEFFNGMAVQPKGKTQMTYGFNFHEERMVERPAPLKALPRGYTPYAFAGGEATIEAAQEVGAKLQSPLALSMENMQAGREIYDVYCIACHGSWGKGDGPVTGPNAYPTPPSLHTEQARAYTGGAIFHVITNGLAQMPGYDHKLSQQQRWQTVQYVRVLQRAQNPKPEDRP